MGCSDELKQWPEEHDSLFHETEPDFETQVNKNHQQSGIEGKQFPATSISFCNQWVFNNLKVCHYYVNFYSLFFNLQFWARHNNLCL